MACAQDGGEPPHGCRQEQTAWRATEQRVRRRRLRRRRRRRRQQRQQRHRHQPHSHAKNGGGRREATPTRHTQHERLRARQRHAERVRCPIRRKRRGRQAAVACPAGFFQVSTPASRQLGVSGAGAAHTVREPEGEGTRSASPPRAETTAGVPLVPILGTTAGSGVREAGRDAAAATARHGQPPGAQRRGAVGAAQRREHPRDARRRGARNSNGAGRAGRGRDARSAGSTGAVAAARLGQPRGAQRRSAVGHR